MIYITNIITLRSLVLTNTMAPYYFCYFFLDLHRTQSHSNVEKWLNNHWLKNWSIYYSNVLLFWQEKQARWSFSSNKVQLAPECIFPAQKLASISWAEESWTMGSRTSQEKLIEINERNQPMATHIQSIFIFGMINNHKWKKVQKNILEICSLT